MSFQRSARTLTCSRGLLCRRPVAAISTKPLVRFLACKAAGKAANSGVTPNRNRRQQSSPTFASCKANSRLRQATIPRDWFLHLLHGQAFGVALEVVVHMDSTAASQPLNRPLDAPGPGHRFTAEVRAVDNGGGRLTTRLRPIQPREAFHQLCARSLRVFRYEKLDNTRLRLHVWPPMVGAAAQQNLNQQLQLQRQQQQQRRQQRRLPQQQRPPPQQQQRRQQQGQQRRQRNTVSPGRPTTMASHQQASAANNHPPPEVISSTERASVCAAKAQTTSSAPALTARPVANGTCQAAAAAQPLRVTIPSCLLHLPQLPATCTLPNLSESTSAGRRVDIVMTVEQHVQALMQQIEPVLKESQECKHYIIDLQLRMQSVMTPLRCLDPADARVQKLRVDYCYLQQRVNMRDIRAILEGVEMLLVGGQ